MKKEETQRGFASPNQVRLTWLDPIKGMAILGIVLYHMVIALFGIPPFDHPKDDWLPLLDRLTQLQPWPNDKIIPFLVLNFFRDMGWLGYQGVHLFLVLSGFGLTWSIARQSPASDVNIKQFFQRRLWRIFPLFWMGHIFFLLFHVFTGQPDISINDPRFYLSLIGFRFFPETFYYVASAWWYVGLILQLYLVFPLLWAWLHRQGLGPFWIGTAVITLISRYILLMMVNSNHEMWSMGVLFTTRLFEFTFGMGLAYWLAHRPQGLEELHQKRWLLAGAVLLYLLGLVLSFTLAGSIIAHSLIAVSLFWMSYNLMQTGLMIVKPLNYTLTWLGRQSYGLMILHQPLLWWFIAWGLPRIQPYVLFLGLLISFLILTILGAAVFSNVVDRLGDRLTRTLAGLGPLLGRRGV